MNKNIRNHQKVLWRDKIRHSESKKFAKIEADKIKKIAKESVRDVGME